MEHPTLKLIDLFAKRADANMRAAGIKAWDDQKKEGKEWSGEFFRHRVYFYFEKLHSGDMTLDELANYQIK